MAESSVGRPALHQISKLAQRYAEHRQETEIISADQLAGAEVGFPPLGRGMRIKRRIGIPNAPSANFISCCLFATRKQDPPTDFKLLVVVDRDVRL